MSIHRMTWIACLVMTMATVASAEGRRRPTLDDASRGHHDGIGSDDLPPVGSVPVSPSFAYLVPTYVTSESATSAEQKATGSTQKATQKASSSTQAATQKATTSTQKAATQKAATSIQKAAQKASS